MGSPYKKSSPLCLEPVTAGVSSFAIEALAPSMSQFYTNLSDIMEQSR